MSEQTKLMLVTGGTNGIGRAAAEALAAKGAHVVLVGRDRQKAEQVANEIRARHTTAVEFLVADLSSQAAVRQLAQQVLERYERIDVLLNNAGGVFDTRQTTVDGIEYTFALNHLAYFLLTSLLLDRLKASGSARIVNVSSAAQATASMDFDDIQLAKRYSGFRAYAQSKLANVMFTYALARRLQGSSVTTNVLHPGLVGTGFGSNTQNRALKVVFGMLKWFSLSPEQGADTAVYLASDPAVATTTGRYFAKRREQRTNALSYDVSAQERLWAISEELTGQKA